MAVANSDSHTHADAVGSPHTVVHAAELSARAIVDGVRRGRSYLAASTGVTLGLVARSDGGSAGLVLPNSSRTAWVTAERW